MKKNGVKFLIFKQPVYKTILFLIFLLAYAQPKAQDLEDTQKEKEFPRFYRWEMGLKVMPTIAFFLMTEMDGGTVEGRQNLMLGRAATTAYNFNPNIGVQVEIINIAISRKYVYNSNSNIVHINYISIPVLLSVNTSKAKRVNLNAVVGPQMGINIGSTIENSSGNGSDTIQNIWTVKQGKMGIGYGSGLEISLNRSRKLRLDIGFRGFTGFLNVVDNSQASKGTDVSYNKIRIQAYSMYVGLGFLF